MKIRKNLVALFLASSLLLSFGSASAAEPLINVLFGDTGSTSLNVYADSPKPMIEIDNNGSSFSYEITRTQQGLEGPVTDGRDGPIVLTGSNVNSKIILPWDFYYEGDWDSDDTGYAHRLTVRSGDSVQTLDFFVTWFSHLQDSFDRISLVNWIKENGMLIEVDPEVKYFSHNTVCSFGPHFRDVSPELTNKWYMFTPLNLSQDGAYSYELVAGNQNVVGSVKVMIEGDSVILTYKYFNTGIWDYEQFFTLFPDYDSITTVNPEEIENAYQFNVPLSIENDLDGDTDVILFVCNDVTFKNNNRDIVRFWPNLAERRALRNSMLEMIGR